MLCEKLTRPQLTGRPFCPLCAHSLNIHSNYNWSLRESDTASQPDIHTHTHKTEYGSPYSCQQSYVIAFRERGGEGGWECHQIGITLLLVEERLFCE